MEKASIVCYANCGFISSEMGKKSLDGVVCARWGGLNVVAAAPFPPHQTITPATPINLKMLFALVSLSHKKRAKKLLCLITVMKCAFVHCMKFLTAATKAKESVPKTK